MSVYVVPLTPWRDCLLNWFHPRSRWLHSAADKLKRGVLGRAVQYRQYYFSWRFIKMCIWILITKVVNLNPSPNQSCLRGSRSTEKHHKHPRTQAPSGVVMAVTSHILVISVFFINCCASTGLECLDQGVLAHGGGDWFVWMFATPSVSGYLWIITIHQINTW